jgi:hypothetical protein
MKLVRQRDLAAPAIALPTTKLSLPDQVRILLML